jgi:hypothetical protein
MKKHCLAGVSAVLLLVLTAAHHYLWARVGRLPSNPFFTRRWASVASRLTAVATHSRVLSSVQT